MTTFLKVLLLILLVVLVVHLWPLAAVPFVILGLALFVLGTITAGGAAVILAAGFSIVGIIVAIVLTVAAVLSPIWIPVLIILGLIALARRKPAAAA